MAYSAGVHSSSRARIAGCLLMLVLAGLCFAFASVKVGERGVLRSFTSLSSSVSSSSLSSSSSSRRASAFGGNRAASVDEDVTIIVRAFERPLELEKLVDSVRAGYPNVTIFVVGDSQKIRPAHLERPDVQYFYMPFDSGNSKGRNMALSQVATRYFVTMDDDFFFTNQTDLRYLVRVLEATNVDIACGAVNNITYAGTLDKRELADGWLTYVNGSRGPIQGAESCVDVDICPQFFMASTERVRGFGGWDNNIHVMDHTPFFFRAWRAGLEMAFCEAVKVGHPTTAASAALRFGWAESRGRAWIEYPSFLERYGLKGTMHFDRGRKNATTIQEELGSLKKVHAQTRSKYVPAGMSYLLTISILSKADHFEKRQVVRNTWLQHISANQQLAQAVLYRFVVANQGQDITTRIKQENTQYGDIMFLEDVEEDYYALSAKMHRFLLWSSQLHVKFHLKTDDDTYVYVPRLLTRLQDPTLPESKLYMGSVKSQTRLETGRYADTEYTAPVYPMLARGAAYVLGGDLVDHIGAQPALHHYSLEDAAISIWLAPVKPNYVNETRLFQVNTDNAPKVLAETYDGLARANVPPDEMIRIYANELTAAAYPSDQKLAIASCVPVFISPDPRNETAELVKWLNLLDAKRVLSSLNVPFFLSDGTLLGYVRECGFIPNDPDIDIGVLATDYARSIEPSMLADGFTLYKTFGSLDSGLEMSFYKRGRKLDIMLYYNTAEYLWHGMFKAGTIRKMKYPLTTFEWVDFLGIKVLAPVERVAFCSYGYGANWTRPAPDFHWWTSKANVFEEAPVLT